MPSGFGKRAGSEVSMGHVFLWGVLAATTLVRGGARNGRLGPKPGVSWSFSAPWPTLPYQRCSQSQGAGAKALRVRSELVLVPLCVHSPPLPTSVPSLMRGAVLEQEGPEWVPSAGQGTHWCSPSSPVTAPDHSQFAM